MNFTDVKNKTWTKNLEGLVIGILIILGIISIPFLFMGISRFFDLYIEYLGH